jgi:hypothetical protein
LARRALALLLPRDGLCAIAVEGLSEEDQEGASASAVEIADATFYFGAGASFQACSRMEIAQFKYSIAAQDSELRFSDAKKTFAKFASAEADFISKRGATLVAEKLRFALVSNRPMSPRLVEACRAAAVGTIPRSKAVKGQYDQLCAAVPWSGEQLRSFASRIELVGSSTGLKAMERANAQTIANWSASDDVLVRARLGDLRTLVRAKAGSAGQHKNLIVQVDVLAALGISHESELLPAPQAFPEVGLS